ncbi:hypothetical protein RKLH11_1377 [Rhodobacteraceae bacterium KLH11]|nr:hypothetical protein RKLH11_1377 [Rhodobacteraceae bacterium KLH11]
MSQEHSLIKYRYFDPKALTSDTIAAKTRRKGVNEFQPMRL